MIWTLMGKLVVDKTSFITHILLILYINVLNMLCRLKTIGLILTKLLLIIKTQSNKWLWMAYKFFKEAF